MRKELLLASTLIFGGGLAAEAQSPAPSYEPAVVVPEVEKLDVSAFVEQVNKDVNTNIDHRFFHLMELRATNNPNGFFKEQKLPDGVTQAYFPDGLDTDPKVIYSHTVTNGVGDDYNGVPLGVNFFLTDDEIKLQLGEDGKIADPIGINLFNFDQLEHFALRDFKQPQELEDLEWTKMQADPTHFAYVYREFKDETHHKYLIAIQTGLLVLANQSIEIPKIGTDVTSSIAPETPTPIQTPIGI